MSDARIMQVMRWCTGAAVIVLAGGFVRWMLLGEPGMASLCAVLAVLLAPLFRWQREKGDHPDCRQERKP
jgi:hypothetical protein